MSERVAEIIPPPHVPHTPNIIQATPRARTLTYHEVQQPLNVHRSIFEGASKYEILHYLRDAKDRIGASSSCSGEIDPATAAAAAASNNEDGGGAMAGSEPVSRVQTPSAAAGGEAAVVTLRRNQVRRSNPIPPS